MYYVYKYYNDDDLLYIGKTVNLSERYQAHLSQWGREYDSYINKIVYAVCNTKWDMDMLEKLMIKKYKPAWNVAELEKDSYLTLEFLEPEFITIEGEELKNFKNQRPYVYSNYKRQDNIIIDTVFWKNVYEYFQEAVSTGAKETNGIKLKAFGYTFDKAYDAYCNGIFWLYPEDDYVGMFGFTEAYYCEEEDAAYFDVDESVFTKYSEVWQELLQGRTINSINVCYYRYGHI